MKTEQASAKHPPSKLTVAFTVLTHILLLAPILYIVGLAFQKYSMFSWHPICMALGAGLVSMEAVFVISGESILSQRMKRVKRVTLHWILNLVGLSLLLIGLIIIVVNKFEKNKAHFQTNHSILGICTIAFATCAAFFGLFANNTKWLYPRVRPVLIKVVHAFFGICITILLLATVINGTYTRWWPGGEAGRNFVFTSLVIAGVLVLFKPILGAISRTKVILNSPPPATS